MDALKKIFVLLAAVVLVLAACGGGDDSDDSEAAAPAEEETAEAPAGDCNTEPVTTDSGLQIKDIECGDGDEAAKGDTLEVHYVGTLEDGTKFDSSRDRGETFQFQVGAGQVIQGWDEGLIGMKVGGLRELTIPPELGYGAAGAGDAIPPNSTLIFEVELVSIK